MAGTKGCGRKAILDSLSHIGTTRSHGCAVREHDALGKADGYTRFNLGVAPLSGLPASPLRRSWMRVGRFVYRHGGAFYNFEGVRAYKDKFAPVWQPRYLVYPAGLSLARVVADITALVAGGYQGVIPRPVTLRGRRAA